MSSSTNSAEDRLPIERHVRVRQKDGTLSEPEPISHYSAVHAWVLMGSPGAGKTDAFLARSQAEGGYYTSARDFVELDLPPGPHPLLFIDGLDEISAGTAMGNTALGQIRTKLQRLGTPRFRISCREADWRGNADSAALQRLAGAENFLELHLEPLRRQEVEALVGHWQASSAQSAADFIKKAEQRDLEGLLDNPQTLRMLVEAVASGWPDSKTKTYEMACAKLVQEHNDQWLAATRETTQPDDELLRAAGYLCALMLLSGGSRIALQRPGGGRQGVVALPELPATSASSPAMASCQSALRTRLFKGDGGGQFFPVHRTVAEYLAACFLAQRINDGLPAKRVLALMLGEDGGVVPELRGLHAWLAAMAAGNLRLELIDRDPLGIILNGDVRSFTRPEKLRVLDALSDEAKRYTYFRTQSGDSQAFGALATADMEEDFRRLLRSADRSPARLALVDCVLDALAHGQSMPGLMAELGQVVRDAGYWPGSRKEALRILIALERCDGQWPVSRQLLADIHHGKVQDSEDELLGTLLSALYPGEILPADIWRYFRRPKSEVLFGSYWRFWHYLAEKNTPDNDSADLQEDIDQESTDLDIEYRKRSLEKERQKLDFFQKTLPSFAEGPADLGALVEISNAYLNLFRRSKEKTAQARLLELLNQNQQWLHLALHGLRQCLFRADLPSARDIIELNAQGRRYNLASPCMAAMELRYDEDPATALNLPESVLEMVAAFRLTNNYDTTPEWFKRLVVTRAEILARVMGPLISAQIATKREHVDGMSALAHDPDYSEIAKCVTPLLLASFPAKAHKNQLQSLRLLIVSLMTRLDKNVQLEIIAAKLKDKPSDVAQRVYWFTTGLQLAPDLYLEPARQYITQTQARVSHLIALVHEQRERNSPQAMLPVAAIEFLIALLGPRCNPRLFDQSGWVSPAMELGRYVEGLVSALAGLHDEAAVQALDSLLQLKDLKPWEDALRRAVFDQRVTRRKALFQPASVAQVCSTLANLTPANAADLWALTLDHLQQLGREIRDGNTNDYRQYWAGDKAELEDNCRDRLLSDLKIRLAPLGINAEPEGRYADEKRADIKLSAQGYNLPVEIKRDKHQDLWKAIQNQLIARYTRELASDGYGIFLVFWFGGAGQPVAGDGGTKPKTALELQQRLQNTVPAELQNKIAVLVIDCALMPAVKI